MNITEYRKNYFHISSTNEAKKRIKGQETVDEWMERTGKKPTDVALFPDGISGA